MQRCQNPCDDRSVAKLHAEIPVSDFLVFDEWYSNDPAGLHTFLAILGVDRVAWLLVCHWVYCKLHPVFPQ